MFATLRRTWELAKQSFAVLRADKEILLFPVMSAVAAILVSISFLVPLLQSGTLQSLTEGEAKPGLYAVLFVFYYLNYFVIIFFNSALVACANIRLSGGRPHRWRRPAHRRRAYRAHRRVGAGGVYGGPCPPRAGRAL